MNKFDKFVMYLCTVLTLCVMYATQPLQPLFEQILDISKFQASLFTTSILAPLAIASIVYGYFLEKFSIKSILFVSFLLFGILELCFAFSSGYAALLNFRAAQGFIAPAALTGIMSYISQNSASNKVASSIGTYVGITIIGGFVGRFLSGFFTDFFGNWRIFFIILGAALLIACFLLTKISGDARTTYTKPTAKDIVQIFKIRHNAYICLFIFGIFFAFQAILNFLPFELLKSGGSYSGSKTGIVYAGYIIGVLVSFNVRKIISFFGSPPRAMLFGTLLFLASIQLLHFTNFYAIFLTMLVVCCGNFIAHAIASGYINSLAVSHKSILNGLYISFYYLGGALGSFAPSAVYSAGGWSAFLILISAVLVISTAFALALKRIDNKPKTKL